MTINAVPKLTLLIAVFYVVFDGGGASRNTRDLFPRHRRHHHHDYNHGFPVPVEYTKRKDGIPYALNFPDCPADCKVFIPNIHEVRGIFQDLLEDPDTRLVYFKLYFTGYNNSLLEVYPFMGQNFQTSEWVWASQNYGRKLLGLPLDADVLSLYILDPRRRHINLHISTSPNRCLVMHSQECRLYAIRHALIHNVTFIEQQKHKRNFLCHRIVNHTLHDEIHWHFLYRCCDTAEFQSGDVVCRTYTTYGQEINGVLWMINIIAGILTLFSPILVLKIKIALKFDSVTKFFRASLKHGITGQRNYVIRISSRQLINLNDPKPFSIPRFLFRLLFHCYGEGRCFIHWWGEWSHQPGPCKKDACCKKCWFTYWRFFAVCILYPIIIYAAVGLYAPRLQYYSSILTFMQSFGDFNPIYLNVNIIATVLIPTYHTGLALWMLFAFVAFLYTILLLSWPNNALERCLLRYDGKKNNEGPALLHDRLTMSYRSAVQKLTYGDRPPKQHFFRIRCIPWGVHRCLLFIGQGIMQIPVCNIAFSLLMYDNKWFNLQEDESETAQRDETEGIEDCSCPTCLSLCKWFSVFIIWIGFLLVLSGYCTAVFLMAQFVLNVLFFTVLGIILNQNSIFPWICFIGVIIFYFDDTLTIINKEHQEILKLIDENSPRISAVEDTEDVFRDGNIQILKTHNLGAVKFIDGDNTEYVSKELYYNVCTDLKCGWTHSLRHLAQRMSVIVLYVLFVFMSLSALGAFTGSGFLLSIVAALISVIPKFAHGYLFPRDRRSEVRKLWAKIMPEILDRHIRVDRTLCTDEGEEELTTYDVRPVGLLEMEVPREIQQRTLRLWKFPWVVSADQQTQTNEGFIVALANKLAAASFLSKIVTRAYSPDLRIEAVLRQWCLLVENCIVEGSATASSINGVPMDSIRLFPRDVQPLVSAFNAGNTIDSVVDTINRELYGPFTKGVLVTIGNTPFALGKLDNMIFAFNGSCHGDQVTDLFGAVLIMADFNTQNLQSTIKYIIDPYSPDAVPVYSIVPTEAFVFRSPEILELEGDVMGAGAGAVV